MSAETTAMRALTQCNEEYLVNDPEHIVGEADGLLNGFVSSFRDEYSTTRQRFAGTLDDARIGLARKPRHAVDAADDCVRKNPWMVFVLASQSGLRMVTSTLLGHRAVRNENDRTGS